ncbi:Tax1-binding protein 3 [Dissostichus eleginoides]|uniref:Tax1-binding protein 3 n=1 Tax=Dissostichus eleginoides TaxID=100907 RepID=A0AAD9C9W5_DISEL|nr:Tax1-binding protein 3 [Dissostichus eleginoides]
MSNFIPGQPLVAVVQRIEIKKLRQGDNLILGFSIGGGIDQDPGQNPFSDDKADKPFKSSCVISLPFIFPDVGPCCLFGCLEGQDCLHKTGSGPEPAWGWYVAMQGVSDGIYVTRITPGGPAETADLRMGDKIMQVNGYDMTMMTHDQARKRLTKKNEDVVRLLVTRKSLEEAVKNSMGGYQRQ